jgi:hypothetical protein
MGPHSKPLQQAATKSYTNARAASPVAAQFLVNSPTFAVYLKHLPKNALFRAGRIQYSKRPQSARGQIPANFGEVHFNDFPLLDPTRNAPIFHPYFTHISFNYFGPLPK